MTNYKTLFADILGLDPSLHVTTSQDTTKPFTYTARLMVELSSDDRSIVYNDDQGLITSYNVMTKRLEIWKAISSDNDLFSFEESKTIDNDSLSFLQNISKKWLRDWQTYDQFIGNNGEPIIEYNEDDPREDR